MSHVSTVSQIAWTSLTALGRAAERIGLELMIGQTTHRWFGRWVNDYGAGDAAYRNGIKPEDYGKCEHAIRLKGDTGQHYEVGLVPCVDGREGWQPVFDSWAQAKMLEILGGAEMTRLQDAYAIEAARETYGQCVPGETPWTIEEESLPDGRTRVRISR